MPLFLSAMPVKHITVDASQTPSDVLAKRFRLQPGEEFTEKAYEHARLELEKSRAFREVDITYKKLKDGVDIHIKADDRSYVFPMLFSFNSHKHALGISLTGGNLFKRGESVSVFVGGSEDGFDTHGSISAGRHTVSMGYSHVDFDQRFYKNGWVSSKGVYAVRDDKGKYDESLLGEVNGKQDDLFLSYEYQFSSLWSVSLTPQYEYYSYAGGVLDGGNHSFISFGLHYADDVRPGMSMRSLEGTERLKKADMLADLPRVRIGKLADISYAAGGSWTGSDYTISKLSVGGSYLWELKQHHVIALFAKAQRAFEAPFSNQVESSDLLFGMGIYDREQRGKGGVSAGLGFTYFVLCNQSGLLSIAPFYEQAYITSADDSWQPHSGVGVTVGYRWWKVPIPISFNFTHNLNDGSRHVGCKVGGKF